MDAAESNVVVNATPHVQEVVVGLMAAYVRVVIRFIAPVRVGATVWLVQVHVV